MTEPVIIDDFTVPRDQLVDGLFFQLTCEWVPEQYDVFIADQRDVQVGYVRLRHGQLSVDVPDCGDLTVLAVEWPMPEDRYKGGFADAAEREAFLRIAAREINRYIPDDDEEG